VSWRAWWLTLALHAGVLRLLAVWTVLVTVGSVLAAWQTHEARVAFDACGTSAAGSWSGACQGIGSSLTELSLREYLAQIAVSFSPLLLGVFLGVPVVAREIEARTAPIAWALDPARRRWFVQRTAPIVVVALIAGILIGFGGEQITASPPYHNHPLGAGFSDYGSRLGQVPVRAVAVTVLGIAIGAILPRQLPALLATGALALILYTLLNWGMGAWMKASAEVIPIDLGIETGSQLYTQMFRDDQTGALIDTSEWDAQRAGMTGPTEGPAAVPGPAPTWPDAPPGMTRVWLGIPGAQYGTWVLREGVIVLAVTTLVGLTTLVVVQRRRPA
jgi:hypothetical protein